MTAISLINLKTTEEITLVLEVSCQGNTNGGSAHCMENNMLWQVTGF